MNTMLSGKNECFFAQPLHCIIWWFYSIFTICTMYVVYFTFYCFVCIFICIRISFYRTFRRVSFLYCTTMTFTVRYFNGCDCRHLFSFTCKEIQLFHFICNLLCALLEEVWLEIPAKHEFYLKLKWGPFLSDRVWEENLQYLNNLFWQLIHIVFP